MSDSHTPVPTEARSQREELEANAARTQAAYVRLQEEFERAVEDPDVIQEDRDSARQMAEQARHVAHDATEALVRFDAGDYGVCAKCGEAIAPERLEAVPDAKTCRKCSF